MRDAVFVHSRQLMDMTQLWYEGKQVGLAEGVEKQRLETAKEMLRNHCDDLCIQLCVKIRVQQLK